jgi:hypothetical protein
MTSSPYSRVLDKFEQKLAPYAVAVAYERTVTDDEDGTTWAMLAFDGEDTETLTVSVASSERAKLTREVETDDIEHAVEHRAGGYPLKTRLADLATHEDLALTADELSEFT